VAAPLEPQALVAVDVGGTFIDFLALDAHGAIRVHKEPTGGADITGAFMAGMAVVAPAGARAVVHGTTVATNALLERRGARTALVTTRGFADVLEIGRQDRPSLYSLAPTRPPPLVPRELRFEVAERVASDGTLVADLDLASLSAAVSAVAAARPEAIAVSFLFSFLRPDHERRAADALRDACGGAFVTASHEVAPEFREFERTSTTVANAYLTPLLAGYLRDVERAAAEIHGTSSFEVMQSSGGLLDASGAAALGVRLILSGPAGGVVGAYNAARGAGLDRVVTLDMGGTSTDVALCDGAVPSTTESVVGGIPLRLPMVDVQTVGAGGGSIARVDSGGALRVGPESAGSFPGPACYGHGDLATVTDAQALAGRLDPQTFLGGAFRLQLGASAVALGRVASELNVSRDDAVRGVLQVVNASMEQAVRRVSVERGHDPRAFALVAFGGAGPLHACELADALGFPRILIPAFPGVTSAAGMAQADRVRDVSRTVMLPLDGDHQLLDEAWRELDHRARDLLPEAAVARSADCRYVGQGYELEVAAERPAQLARRFHAAHHARYGYSAPERGIEVVTLRVRATRSRDALVMRQLSSPAAKGRTTRLLLDEGAVDAPVVERGTLPSGNILDGPALVVQPDSATLITLRWRARVLESGDLLMERRR
jgi:N-methylhydantoinase A